MLSFDIPTLSLVATLAAAVSMASLVAIWRLVPSEASLRDWVRGFAVLGGGLALLGLRQAIPETLSIVGGNALLVLGVGYVHIGSLGLLHRPRPGRWHWAAAVATGAGCLWFAVVTPSVAARIVILSSLVAPFLLAAAWAFFRHADADLRVSHRITAVVLSVGGALLLFRAAAAPGAAVAPDYAWTTSITIAVPYLYVVVASLWLGVTVPLTVSARLQRQLAIALEHAEAASRAKSAFLSSMSHELRTPLNAILGFAQILDYDEGIGAEQRGYAREIIKGGRHLLDLINDVLDLARIESGRVAVSIDTVPLAGLGAECRDLVQPLAVRRQLVLSVDIASGLAVRADPMRLKQVLLNLMSNAVKYNRDGGTIRLAAIPVAEGRVRVTVTDSGPGIPAARLAELFLPFSRLGQETSGIEGTGIGLTIAQRLIQMMEGTIGVDSEEGVGTTAWIELPGTETVAAA